MPVPATLEQNVKERVKEIVGEMIPEEMWDTLVSNAIAEFKQVDLPKLVKAGLTEKYKAVIVDELCKPEWQTQWKDGRQSASEMVHQIILGAAPEILTAMIGLTVQNMICNLRSQVHNYR
ncbi:MAG: hypothetical protein ABIJ57_02205 [Pseudomonadota bacterium]